MKSKYYGICQVCFSKQKLPGNNLSLHGYQRPGFGHIVGDCPGSYELPFEKSCEITNKFLNSLIVERDNMNEYMTALQKRTVPAMEYRYPVGRNDFQSFLVKNGEPGTYRDVRGHVVKVLIPSFESLVLQKISDLSMELKHLNGEIDYLIKKISSWEPKDLQPVITLSDKRFLIQMKYSSDSYKDFYGDVNKIRHPLNVWIDIKVVKEYDVKHSLDVARKNYKYEVKGGIVEFRSVPLPYPHILKKYKVSDYQEEHR